MKRIFFFACIICTSGIVYAQNETKSKPKPPPPPPPKVEVTSFTPSVNEPGVKNFLKQNTGVASVYWNNQHTIVLRMKDKTTKAYDLSDSQIKKTFIDNYGEIPGPLPPVTPPPPPPAPPLPPPPPPKKNTIGVKSTTNKAAPTPAIIVKEEK